MKVSEIIYRVKAAIDELPNSGEGNIVGDEAYDNLSSIIRDKIPYALEWVLTNAPQTKIDSSMVTSFEGGSAESGGQLEMTFGIDYMVTVKLPDNFLRILSAFTAGCWMKKTGGLLPWWNILNKKISRTLSVRDSLADRPGRKK